MAFYLVYICNTHSPLTSRALNSPLQDINLTFKRFCRTQPLFVMSISTAKTVIIYYIFICCLCISVLAEDAIKAALSDYRIKQQVEEKQ